MLHLAVYSQHTPYPQGGGGARRNSDLFKRMVTSLYPRSREYLTSDYISHDFVTVGHMCAITTALHSPTSINRRLPAASKVVSLSLYNPHSEALTTRKINFRDGRNPSLNYQNSLTNEFSEGFCDDR